MTHPFAVTLSALTLLQAYGQSFSGVSRVFHRAVTTIEVSANIGGVANSATKVVTVDGPIDMAATLNPGTITFDHLNYTPTSSITISPFAVTWTDPNTFQSATYNVSFKLNPYSFTSSGNNSLSLTPRHGVRDFDARNSFTRDPIQITGTIVVDGPNQDLTIPFSTSAPESQSSGFIGSIYEPDYPASITVIPASLPPSNLIGALNSSVSLYAGTIDGLPITIDLIALDQRFEDGFNIILAAVPEPGVYPLAAGLALLGFGLIRSTRRRDQREQREVD